MGKKSRFVRPETVNLDLSDGDWIEVKSRLTYGEQQSFAMGHLRYDSKTERVEADLTESNIKRFATWIVDWSFVDEDGKLVAVSKSAIANLDPEAADEIDKALSAYIEQLESEKN